MYRLSRNRLVSLSLGMGLGIALVSGSLTPTLADAAGQSVAAVRSHTIDARRLLHLLKTSPEHNANYERSKFANWRDADGDGCDTRAEVLLTESFERVHKGPGCHVLKGKWLSSYDGRVVKRAAKAQHRPHGSIGGSMGFGCEKVDQRDTRTVLE